MNSITFSIIIYYSSNGNETKVNKATTKCNSKEKIVILVTKLYIWRICNMLISELTNNFLSFRTLHSLCYPFNKLIYIKLYFFIKNCFAE